MTTNGGRRRSGWLHPGLSAAPDGPETSPFPDSVAGSPLDRSGQNNLRNPTRTMRSSRSYKAALARVVRNKAEAAYARSDPFEKRRALVESWSEPLAA